MIEVGRVIEVKSVTKVMNRILRLCGALAAGSVLIGCDNEGHGFALPPGNVEQGEAAFVELQCNRCHSVKDSVQRMQEGAHPQIYIQLGGEKTRVTTYGELVTSIINPSHRLARGMDPRHVNSEGESKMPRYNDVMTVQQLVDLTKFLSRKYSVWTPEYRVVPHR